jgi:hypothetical protein
MVETLELFLRCRRQCAALILGLTVLARGQRAALVRRQGAALVRRQSAALVFDRALWDETVSAWDGASGRDDPCRNDESGDDVRTECLALEERTHDGSSLSE